jgi:hypothetical protein
MLNNLLRVSNSFASLNENRDDPMEICRNLKKKNNNEKMVSFLVYRITQKKSNVQYWNDEKNEEDLRQ